MNLEEILGQWSIECVIDKVSLDETSRQTPVLHAKYLQLLTHAKLMLKRAEASQKVLLKNKWLYYNGKLDQAAIKNFGWDPDPFDGLKVLKGEMDYYYDSDPDIQKSEEKIQYYKTIIETLTEIVTSLNWRHQTISNIIRWKQFEAGG